MTPDTRILGERALSARTDAIQLCQETEESLRRLEGVRVETAWLRSELGHQVAGLQERIRLTHQFRRGAGL